MTPPPPELATAVDVLRWAAGAHGDAEAYVEPATGDRARRSLTFGAWDRAADGVAGFLASLGVGHGDVVALLLPSGIDYAVIYAAAQRRGAVTSGINPRLGAAELASVVRRARPAVTVWDPALGIGLPEDAGRVVTGAETMAAAGGPPPARPVALHPSDPVAVVWTSGTTGDPKGAVFDHANLAAVAGGTDVLSRPGDRRLSPLPFPHVGYMTRTWDEALHRVTTVVTPQPWRAVDALATLQAERISVAQGVPTQWALVLALPETATADFSALRIAGTGAARVPAELVAAMRAVLGVPVVVRYTSTETSLGTGTRPDDPDEVVATTVGRPVPGVELRITDEDGADVAPGEVGRVRLRSAAAMRGYWADRSMPTHGTAGGAPGGVIDAEATAAVRTPDGWIVTGDYGWLTEEGNLRLAGRANEMYIRGGYNVFPAEVEDVLAGHPAIDRAAVVGTPDPVLGEVGVAFVELADPSAPPPALDDLRAMCAARLADYKAPDALVVVASLPLTAMMKVDKRALAASAAEAAPRRPAGTRPSGAGVPAPSMVAGQREEGRP